MTAEELLQSVRRIDHLIQSKRQTIQELTCLAEKVTANYGGETVAHSRNVRSMEDTMARIADLTTNVRRDLEELVVLKIKAKEVIQSAAKAEWCAVLERRYMQNKAWKHIAEELHVDLSTVYRWHDSALRDVNRKFPLILPVNESSKCDII